MRIAYPGWTAAEDATARELWTVQGLSAQRVSDALPGRTRNAVIGRVNRLGLQRHGYNTPVRAPKPDACTWPRKPRAPRMPPAAFRVAQDRQKPEPAPIQPLEHEAALRGYEVPGNAPRAPVPFVDATSSQCQWPQWPDDALPSQKFVCGVAVAHAPYCAEHFKRAYQPMKVRPERKAKPGRIMWAAE